MKAEIFQKTRELGELIAGGEECARLQAAQAAVNEDMAAQVVIRSYNALQEGIQELMQGKSPDTKEVGRLATEMQAIQGQMMGFASVRELNEAQKAFAELFADVNQVLKFMITGEAAEESLSCGGGCASCAGCSALQAHAH
ncbi:MAG: YlbF family regulator [Christensenellaceae bacterium]|jgi:cell fate (sporulation/competence/biofilm development) regulator YlbF (YheA/YmcA/DUF963 family)|nr:YlbF family regulator [Christensenellaceae bacterium]